MSSGIHKLGNLKPLAWLGELFFVKGIAANMPAMREKNMKAITTLRKDDREAMYQLCSGLWAEEDSEELADEGEHTGRDSR
jgi:hypothetical protein